MITRENTIKDLEDIKSNPDQFIKTIINENYKIYNILNSLLIETATGIDTTKANTNLNVNVVNGKEPLKTYIPLLLSLNSNYIELKNLNITLKKLEKNTYNLTKTNLGTDKKNILDEITNEIKEIDSELNLLKKHKEKALEDKLEIENQFHKIDYYKKEKE